MTGRPDSDPRTREPLLLTLQNSHAGTKILRYTICSDTLCYINCSNVVISVNVLKPVEPPFSPEIEAALRHYPKGRDGYLLRLFRVFANSLRFATTKGVSNLLDKDSPLSLRQREIVILRVTANWGCEYEWGVHVTAFADAARLSEAQVAATRLGMVDAPCWSDSESVLLACVDQLCANAKIENETYREFQSLWSVEQQLEILSLCGNYYLISCVANSARIEREEMGACFPALSA